MVAIWIGRALSGDTTKRRFTIINAKGFFSLTLTLLFVCLLNHSAAGLYVEGTDFSATTTILEARHLVVGEITDVSYVFELIFPAPEGEVSTSGPLSIVTVRVDKDIKAAIARAENPDSPKPKDGVRTVRFAQVGGPDRDGNVTEAADLRLLKKGEYVFLKLVPSDYPITNKGITVHSCPRPIGSISDVEQRGRDNVDKHIIKRGWGLADVTVLDMTRIVRATLKKPQAMRRLSKKIGRLSHLAEIARLEVRTDRVKAIEAVRLQMLMAGLKAIEKGLNLPDLKGE